MHMNKRRITKMDEIPVHVGDQVIFEKTVGESDVYLYAGITGDLNANHVNEAVMRKTRFGQRIAHGALILGFISTASTRMIELGLSRSNAFTPVGLGYDRSRFIAPVFIGNTISVIYTISEVDQERLRTVADVTVTTEDERLVVVAKHLMKWLPIDQEHEVGVRAKGPSDQVNEIGGKAKAMP